MAALPASLGSQGLLRDTEGLRTWAVSPRGDYDLGGAKIVSGTEMPPKESNRDQTLETGKDTAWGSGRASEHVTFEPRTVMERA